MKKRSLKDWIKENRKELDDLINAAIYRHDGKDDGPYCEACQEGKIEKLVNQSSSSVEDESRIDDLQYELLRIEERRKWNREMRKRIEAVLHPCPKFGDIEILHEHKRNGACRFSAWKDNLELRFKDGERRSLELVREAFIDNPNFYKEHEADMIWLAGKGEE